MFSVISLLTFVTLALGVATSPVVVVDRSPILSLPLKRVNNFTSGHDILARDLARVQRFRDRAKARATGQPVKRQSSEPVSNQVVSYIASVGVGASDSQFQLIVDTGSSNTWVGATKRYTATSTSTDTEDAVSVSYGSGDFSGTEFIDRVTLSSSLVINQQSIGVASSSEGFEGVDGILGIGPVDLTEDTVENVNTVPTVTDNLFAQGTIAQNLVAVSFAPTDAEVDNNGELTFGGTDSTKFTGEITFVMILTLCRPRNGDFWGITQTVTYGSTSILGNTDGIVDTGTTLILFDQTAFNAYTRATGAVLDNNTGLLRVTTAQFNALQNLNFNIGGTTFSLTPNAQIFPRSLNTLIGGVANDIYLIVGNLGPSGEEPFNFVNGYAFLERFYSVFDTGNNRVGIATTPNTNAETN
ncbi:hypothetical protein GYMLUDRAFT_175162 [Collybiopsis luxurians FD-317 M1]|uniref:Peptidase A1 domain-containing protein n=1 Tax=Collybiopsis luxurians FD-317 M1 TaxID=944289 RepID=A0A0D0CKL5_9AGAR|nr:hypothetical protein GYMLUDRAFT_175162 [Collybiopsis luxurians FD-317 M1]